MVTVNPQLVSAFKPELANPVFADPPFQGSDWFDVDKPLWPAMRTPSRPS